MCGGAGWSWWGSPSRGTEFMALVNKGVQDRGTEEGYVPETLFTQDEESTASLSLTPPQPSPLITTFFRGAANTMPSHSPPLALNHCWDNEENPPLTTTTITPPLPNPPPSFCPSPTPKQTLLLLKFFAFSSGAIIRARLGHKSTSAIGENLPRHRPAHPQAKPVPLNW
ncbi:unnamed protein product [Pleuronectes platessa]|uniref:Uncharacterized protein n=1 Tax=Pleuronectes platessa TaxID=8262 RepID=A0A9N7YRE6_PLEPL|nr:unnamed protein product [Pleuronectes platessa]